MYKYNVPPAEWPKTFIFLGSKEPLLEYSGSLISTLVVFRRSISTDTSVSLLGTKDIKSINN
jgi:hypothetical protein